MELGDAQTVELSCPDLYRAFPFWFVWTHRHTQTTRVWLLNAYEIKNMSKVSHTCFGGGKVRILKINYMGTGAVNAFEIYYTWFKIWSIKGQKSSTGQLENSFDLQIKFGVEFANGKFAESCTHAQLSTYLPAELLFGPLSRRSACSIVISGT